MNKKNKKVNNCNLCGMCSLNCPLYKVLIKESSSPRFKAFLARKKEFKEIFFLCTECDACVQDCPTDIDIECLKIREAMVKQGAEMPSSKEMRENIKHYGNPFGEIKKGKKIKQYYT